MQEGSRGWIFEAALAGRVLGLSDSSAKHQLKRVANAFDVMALKTVADDEECPSEALQKAVPCGPLEARYSLLLLAAETLDEKKDVVLEFTGKSVTIHIECTSESRRFS